MMLMGKSHDFAQIVCLEGYSVVRARIFEFFFNALILYNGILYCDKICHCNELQVCRYDAKFRVLVDN